MIAARDCHQKSHRHFHESLRDEEGRQIVIAGTGTNGGVNTLNGGTPQNIFGTIGTNGLFGTNTGTNGIFGSGTGTNGIQVLGANTGTNGIQVLGGNTGTNGNTGGNSNSFFNGIVNKKKQKLAQKQQLLNQLFPSNSGSTITIIPPTSTTTGTSPTTTTTTITSTPTGTLTLTPIPGTGTGTAATGTSIDADAAAIAAQIIGGRITKKGGLCEYLIRVNELHE